MQRSRPTDKSRKIQDKWKEVVVVPACSLAVNNPPSKLCAWYETHPL